MSASAFYIQDLLCRRSTESNAGIRKFVKTSTAKASRKQGQAAVVREVEVLQQPEPHHHDLTELRELSWEELDAYADALLLSAQAQLDQRAAAAEKALGAPAELIEHDEEELSRVPLQLQASLPDWMLSQLYASKGNAFDELSLFEAKSPSPEAAISMVDEVMYA